MTLVPPTAVRRQRVAVSVLFVLAGTVMGGWSGRIPSVRSQLGVGDGEWGLIVMALPLGVLVSLLVLQRVITRTGARRPAVCGAAGMLAITPLAAAATTTSAMVTCLLALGVAAGLLYGPMNALAVEVERGYGRSILSSFHAWFSAGQFAGGLLGVLAGLLYVAPSIQLATSSLLLAGVYLASLRRLPDTRTPVEDPPALHEPATTLPDQPVPSTRSWTPQLLVLALMSLLTSINEGGATQWSAQYTVSLGGGIALGSLTLVCYSLAIATVRLVGDRLVGVLGRRTFLQLSGGVVAAGLGIALLVGTVPAALIGFACVGIGSGCIVPTVVTLAGNQPTVPSAKAVALMSLGEWPAFLFGPPLIGALAELVGLRAALSVIVAGGLAIVVLAGFVHDRTPALVQGADHR
ncbi:MFS transporter [Micropruina sp.]|uniref:MFS transporter n=1 Tax=Micropruina sp. TaxID=2737536 RepID=UPI0039E5D264